MKKSPAQTFALNPVTARPPAVRQIGLSYALTESCPKTVFVPLWNAPPETWEEFKRRQNRHDGGKP